MPNLKALSMICSLLQIIGLILVIISSFLPLFVWVIIGISGFAATVKIFLPLENHQSFFSFIATLCGIGIIIFSCLYVALITY